MCVDVCGYSMCVDVICVWMCVDVICVWMCVDTVCVWMCVDTVCVHLWMCGSVDVCTCAGVGCVMCVHAIVYGRCVFASSGVVCDILIWDVKMTGIVIQRRGMWCV